MTPIDVFVVTFGAGMLLLGLLAAVITVYVYIRDWWLVAEGMHGCHRGRHLWRTEAINVYRCTRCDAVRYGSAPVVGG